MKFFYPKPVNFDSNNPEFDQFKKIDSDEYFEPKIDLVKNVRISTNSVVFRYFKIFKESCISDQNYQQYQKGHRFFLKFIFPKPNFSKKRFLLITDEWTSNYYHWHNFALKKLLILQEKNLIKDSLLFLPKKYLSYKFVLPSLEKFDISKNQIVFLPKQSNIKVAELPLVIASRQDPILFKKLRAVITKNSEKVDLGFGEKIYISREGQLIRLVENESEVVALLEKYGFKKLVAEKFSYDEQVSIFSKAKYVVAPHGAGLTNILFMPERSFVLEMATHHQSLNATYYSMAAMLNVNYLYQKCKIGNSSKVKDFHQGNILVDLAKLEKNLKLILKNAES